MPKVNINDFDRNNNNAGKESKRWKGLKQDSSGKYLVYVTDTSERLFEDLDSAVQYLKEAAIKGYIKKEAFSYTEDLFNKKITREDGELFNKAVNQAIENGVGYWLLKENIITQEDLNNIMNNQGGPKEASRKQYITKEASKENAVVQRGQENLDGLKEVITKRKLVQTADGRYKVMESKRYNMKSDDSNDAKNKLRNIDVAKEQTEELPQEDAFKDVKDEIGGTEGKKQKREIGRAHV